MKTIGLLGGMSWESTASYYQSINQLVKDQLGGLHSARIYSTASTLRRLKRCRISETGIMQQRCS